MGKFSPGLLALILLPVLAVAGVLFKYDQWRDDFNQSLVEDSQLASTAKGQVEYATLGRAEHSKNRLLILHDTPGGFDSGKVLVDWLALGEDSYVVIPSRPGYLRTPLSVGKTPAQAADAMAALLDALALEDVVVLGWGGGAPTALALAEQYPHKVKGLVLLSPRIARNNAKTVVGETDEGLLEADFKAYGEHLLFELLPDSFKEGSYAESVSDFELTLERQAQLAPTSLPPSMRKQGLFNDLKVAAGLPLEPELNIHLPTLIIYSPTDEQVPSAQAQYAASKIEGAEVYEVENESHFGTMNALAVGQFHAFLEGLRK